MDAVHQNRGDVTPCPVCNLNQFIDAQTSSATPSEDDLSVHLHQKHNVRLSHKILAKSILDVDISKETLNDVDEIAQDFLLVLKNVVSLNDENSFLRRKLLETKELCKNMAGDLWKCANDAHNAGRDEFNPEEQIGTDVSWWKCAVSTTTAGKAEQTFPEVAEGIVVDRGEAMECFSSSLDQSEFTCKEYVQAPQTDSSSQVQIAELVTSSISENQIMTSTHQNMEPQTVGSKPQTLMDEQIETQENDKATKISSPDNLLEGSSNGIKYDNKVNGSLSTMTRGELAAKIRTKLKEFSNTIEVSARNLQTHIEYAKNLETVSDVSQEEVEDMSKKIEEYKSIHLKLEESLALKIKKLNDTLKNLTEEEEMIDSEFCELLEEIMYNNKEVLFTQPRVLKLPENEDDPDSDSKEMTDQPINYDPPSVPHVTQVICPKCSKVFKNKEDYCRHKKEHYHSQFFSCKSCPKVFTNAATFLSHQKRHSEGSALKKCQFCPFTSKESQFMLMHMRSVHTKEKLFPCNNCSKSFHSYMALEGHIKKHQDKTKKQCEKCKQFHAKKTNHKCY